MQPGEKELIEEYVNLKLKDRNTWRLVWDPDKYIVGWIKRLNIKKEEREGEEKQLQEKQFRWCWQLGLKIYFISGEIGAFN